MCRHNEKSSSAGLISNDNTVSVLKSHIPYRNTKIDIRISFGVSAMLTNSMGQRDTFVGTYNYMSPERISGRTYDYKSDIWSLGMVILECAMGRFPYIQSEEQQAWPSFYELLEAIVGSPPPSALLDHFSPEFCSFVSAW
ncbi:hypothetical protein ACSBR1_020386 [Camellia fascicularis]